MCVCVCVHACVCVCMCVCACVCMCRHASIFTTLATLDTPFIPCYPLLSHSHNPLLNLTLSLLFHSILYFTWSFVFNTQMPTAKHPQEIGVEQLYYYSIVSISTLHNFLYALPVHTFCLFKMSSPLLCKCQTNMQINTTHTWLCY